MSIELKCLISWPDDEKLRQCMPKCFQKHYSNVTCIIDCFEIFIQMPAGFSSRAATYSNYKKTNTVKVLIGITPTGSISFISQAWGGRISDREISAKSGFLDCLKQGDVIMVDRGFNISEELAVRGLIPPFTRNKPQLPALEVEKARQLSRVRIHVERVIGQLRKKYKILQNKLPISLIKRPSDKSKLNCTIDKILVVTAALTNIPYSRKYLQEQYFANCYFLGKFKSLRELLFCVLTHI